MKQHTALSLTALIIGFIGGGILSWGAITQTYEEMLHLTSPYSQWVVAPEQITALAEQKAENTVGLIVVGLAFLIEFITLSFFDDKKKPPCKPWQVFCGIACISILLCLAAHFFSRKLANHHRKEIGRVAIKDYLQNHVKETLDNAEMKSIEDIASDLLKVDRCPGEQQEEFLLRIGRLVNRNVPTNHLIRTNQVIDFE